MKSLFLFVCVIGVSFNLFADGSPAEFEMREHLIAKKGSWTHTFTVNGVSCATVDDLKRAVSLLPPGSNLTWNIGCILYSAIPVGPGPAMKVKEFEAYCAEHQVTFRVKGGW